MTTKFQPINSDHAIESVSWVLEYDAEFSSEAIAQLQNQHELWRNRLPAVRRPKGFAVSVEDETVRAVTLPGVEFAYLMPDGQPIWALRFVGRELVIECRRYSRWAKVRDQALELLRAACSIDIESPKLNTPKKLSLKVLDAFLNFDSDYDLKELFVPNKYLSEHLFSVGPDWHLYTGWFDRISDERVLQNINIDAVSRSGANGPADSVKFLHSLTAFPDATKGGAQCDEFIEWVTGLVEALHVENKAMMEVFLQQEIQTAIALQGKK
ncbi:hypothetical protein [Maricaulis sp. CAU 1757]